MPDPSINRQDRMISGDRAAGYAGMLGAKPQKPQQGGWEQLLAQLIPALSGYVGPQAPPMAAPEPYPNTGAPGGLPPWVLGGQPDMGVGPQVPMGQAPPPMQHLIAQEPVYRPAPQPMPMPQGPMLQGGGFPGMSPTAPPAPDKPPGSPPDAQGGGMQRMLDIISRMKGGR